MKKTVTLLAALFFIVIAFSQNKTGSISGNISNADNKAIEAATVQLLRAADKGLVKLQ